MTKCIIDHCKHEAVGRGLCNKHYIRERKAKSFNPKPKVKTDVAIGFIGMNINYKGDDCVLWPFGDSSGYGANINGLRPHVLMCNLVHGPKPTSGHEVAHSCNVKKCINPMHLRWATVQENGFDRAIYGSGYKLSYAERIAIGESREPTPILATRYGVSRSLINDIRGGRHSSHITGIAKTTRKSRNRFTPKRKVSGEVVLR